MPCGSSHIWKKSTVALNVLHCLGCTRAPSFDILGSFFPAWLLCLVLGILGTILARWLLLRMQVMVFYPVLVYPSLTAMFTFALWLIFFR